MSPDELARELGVTGTAVRTYLREMHTRAPEKWGKMWVLDEKLVAAVRERFKVPYVRAATRDEMVILSVAIPMHLHRSLGARATRDHRSLNDIVREALSEWFARVEKDAFLEWLAVREKTGGKR